MGKKGERRGERFTSLALPIGGEGNRWVRGASLLHGGGGEESPAYSMSAHGRGGEEARALSPLAG